MGVQIVGASFGEPEQNRKWIKNQSYAFEVWTDDDKSLALHYGAIDSKDAARPGRVTRVLDSEGTLVLEYKVGLNLGTHPQDVLEDCAALFNNGVLPPGEN